MKRLLLVSVVLLAGCGPQSVLTPGMSPRQAVTQYITNAAKGGTVPQKATECFQREFSDALTDDEMVQADRALLTNSPYPVAIRAIESARSKCGF